MSAFTRRQWPFPNKDYALLSTCPACSADYYSPWRAPGTAPVINSCGSAGGRLPGQGPGGAGANYQNNSIAYLGMPGTDLPQMEPQATWKAGTAVEVGWAIEAQ